MNYYNFGVGSVDTPVKVSWFQKKSIPRLYFRSPTIEEWTIHFDIHYKLFFFFEDVIPMRMTLRNAEIHFEGTWEGLTHGGNPEVRIYKIEPKAKGTEFASQRSHTADPIGFILTQSTDIFCNIVKNSIYFFNGSYFDNFFYKLQGNIFGTFMKDFEIDLWGNKNTLFFDYAEAVAPKFKTDYMELSMLGSISNKHNAHLPKPLYYKFPKRLYEQEVMQVMISDMVPTSFLWALYDYGYFKFDSNNPDNFILNEVISGMKEPLHTVDVEDVFPKLYQLYPNNEMRVKVVCTAPPKLVVRPGWAGNLVITFPTKFRFDIQLGKKSSMTALEVEGDVEVLADVALSREWLYMGLLGSELQNMNIITDLANLSEDADSLKHSIDSLLLTFNRLVDEEYLINGFEMPSILSHFITDFSYLDGAVVAEVQFDM